MNTRGQDSDIHKNTISMNSIHLQGAAQKSGEIINSSESIHIGAESNRIHNDFVL